MPPFIRIAITTFVLACASTAVIAQEEGPSLSEIVEAWLASPHADRSSEAFIHWNEDGEVPGRCAVCHSSLGLNSYVGTPMSVPGIINHSVALGTTVDCTACHTSAATNLDAVPFPSGVTIDGLGTSATCTVCHQGRASTDTVLTATQDMAEDAVIGDLQFINVHYAPSASTQLGTLVRGGFEYDGKVYKGRFDHVPDLNTCTSCHSPHSLQVNIANCTSCHQGVENFTDIRTSPGDFDGDGDSAEGIAGPIGALHARLGDAIQRYAAETAGVPVVYASSAYPYFFIDGDGDGAVTDGEAAYPNRYQSWTPRLLKAAYNYQLVAKEPAIYAHNPHYALQLLFDSLESLSEQVDVDMAGLTRP
ncbi:MAG: polyheme membrane-associated cytochrome C [Pseudomonadota bacterium]